MQGDLSIEEVARIAKGLTKAKHAFIRRGYVQSRRGFWPMSHALSIKGLVRHEMLTPLGIQVRDYLANREGR